MQTQPRRQDIDVPSGFIILQMVLLILEEGISRVEGIHHLVQRPNVDSQREVLSDEFALELAAIALLDGVHDVVDRHLGVLHHEVEGLYWVVLKKVQEGIVIRDVAAPVHLLAQDLLGKASNHVVHQAREL